MILVSKGMDEWLSNIAEHNTIWVAELDNGETIYQDDNRPGVYPESAWTRLRTYVHANDLSIKKVYLRFRSNYLTVAEDVDGFFFIKAILGGFGMKKPVYYYTVGVLDDEVIKTKKIRVPELLIESEDVREAQYDDICLIRNAYGKKVQKS